MPKTEITATEIQPKAATEQISPMAVLTPIATWVLPGAGHFLQKKWTRGFLLLFAVALMFVLGIAMGGRIYKANGGDLLDMLGFVGDAGTGGLYVASRIMDLGIVNFPHATADFGTKFIVIAGLLNVMSAVDAFHIAMGRKQ
jgi:hypothetical protein